MALPLTDQQIKNGFRALLPFMRLIVCVFILMACIAILIAMSHAIWDIYLNLSDAQGRPILHDVALILVQLKALRILISYLATHHVRLHHIVEIAVIASVVEIVFAPERHSLWMIIIFAVFAVTNLLIMVVFYDTLKCMNVDPENGKLLNGE